MTTIPPCRPHRHVGSDTVQYSGGRDFGDLEVQTQAASVAAIVDVVSTIVHADASILITDNIVRAGVTDNQAGGYVPAGIEISVKQLSEPIPGGSAAPGDIFVISDGAKTFVYQLGCLDHQALTWCARWPD